MTLEISGTTQNLLLAEAAKRDMDAQALASEMIFDGLIRLEKLRQKLEFQPGFDVFSGLWSESETEEFEQNTADFRMVTPRFFTNPKRPIIVCLCGSTRFYDVFSKLNLEETLAGKIVLSIASDRTTENEIFSDLTVAQFEEAKQKLGKLHFQKIELADEILVVNVNGYIGESTTQEVNYALRIGKKVRWFEPDKIPEYLNK